MLRTRSAWCLLAGLLAFAAAARAHERVVVAPTVDFLRAVKDKPPSWLRPGVLDPSGFQGTIRFDTELCREDVERLELVGITFSRRFAEPPDVDHIGSVYPVHVAWEGLDLLLEFPALLQVEPVLIDRPLLPLEVTGPLCTVPRLAQAVEVMTAERGGEGVKIADVDHGIDVFHPSFFYADGGFYPWLDVDGDGELTFGVDAVDLDGDGEAAPAETLEYEDVDFIDLGDEDSYGGLDGDSHFEPAVDWLFADTNGNGKRDFGPGNGFSDQSPAFGEPIFVVDDVDRDGEAGTAEKLVRLSTSKIAKALVAGEEFVRGDNLTFLDPYLFGHEDWVPEVTHGTAVAGILAANTPGHSRLVGMAPYAEIYLVDFGLDSFYQKGTVDSDLNKLMWAAEQEVDIILFEFGTWAITFLDGSTNLEHAMDELSLEKGIIQVAAAGNLGGKGKHMFKEFPAGPTALDVVVPRRWGTGNSKAYSPSNLYLSLYWEGDAGDVGLILTLPEGDPGMPVEELPVPAHTEEPVQIGADLFLTSFSAKSSRGFMLRFITVFREEGEGVPTGVWSWNLHNNTGADLPVHGFLKDSQTSWSTSVKFAKWKTSYTTLCHPATADSAITVGAYGARFCPESKIGKLRWYSSRGPRMDGDLGLEIAAPADPYTASPFLTADVLVEGEHMFGGYREFSGTSGAAPHVAGALALLKQLKPDATPAELLADLAAGARVDHLMLGTNLAKKWGYGKLDAYAAAFGLPPLPNMPPVAVPDVGERRGLTVLFDATASQDPEGGGLQFRWDFEYDGQYDTAWADEPVAGFTYSGEGSPVAKLEVRDAEGAVAAALLQLEVADDWVEPAPEAKTAPEIGDRPEPVPDVTGAEPEATEPAGGGNGGGCGCRASGGPAGPPWVLLWLLLLAHGFRRGPKRRRHQQNH